MRSRSALEISVTELASVNGAETAFDSNHLRAGINHLRAFEEIVRAQVARQDQVLADRLTAAAQKIIDKAIKQVAQLRGRLGAFQKFTLGSTINSLGVAYENASAAESAIADTDFAAETANLLVKKSA